jgi:type VI secretion system protein ImpK
MATSDDPFAHDPERTVIRPMPGRRTETPAKGKATPPPQPRAAPSAEEAGLVELVSVGVNRLADAASALLALAVRLRGSVTQSDVPALRDRIVRELRRFEQKLRSAGAESDTLRTAHFALCALIDNIVLNTPWGRESNWAAQTLSSVFHKRNVGGDEFFDILHALRRNAGSQLDVLELLYLCLSIGFEGRHREDAAKHAKEREETYQEIRRRRGEFERELSPHWQGIPAAHRPLASQIPLWVFGLGSGAVLMAIFLTFFFTLSNASDPVFGQIATLPPGKNVAIRGGDQLPVLENHAPRLREFLADEIRRGLVEVRDDDRTITIAIHGSSTFAVGSATLQTAYRQVVERIGTALRTEPGRVTVSGHTDSTPVRRNAAFPSNYELSLKRAETARDIIRAQLATDGERVVAEGMGESMPLFPNDTPENREQNRRIEITLLKPLAG